MAEALNSAGLLLGGSWASGVNLYLTVAGLGISQKMGWIALPGDMETLSHPLIIVSAIVLYGIEFFADKIPLVDSTWDTIHTFIRPAGGFSLGYLAMPEAGPVVQTLTGLLTGSIAMDSHLTKATTRVAINTSPEPFSNSAASITEDLTVAGVLVLIAKHPVIASILVILFIFFSVWFLKTMFRFLKKIFTFKKEKPSSAAPSSEAPSP